MEHKNRKRRLWLFLLLACFLIAVTLVGRARAPWWDEAAFADSAYNLAFHGVFGSTTWRPLIRGLVDFPQMDRYTYWMMPLYSASLGVWFSLFGFSIFSMHSYSLLWGAVILVSAYTVVKRLSGSEAAALGTAALLAVNTSVVYSASTGRPDCMCAALGLAALAVYTVYRERHLTRAIFLAAALIGCAVICHPMGAIHAAVLTIAVLVLDWRRIRLIHVAAAALPVLLAVGAWGVYTLQAPDIFRAQFAAHVGSRTEGVTSPLGGIAREIVVRYYQYWTNNPGLFEKSRVLVPIAYLAGYAFLLVSGAWRTIPAARVALAVVPAAFLGLSFLDGTRVLHYLVHVFPVYTIMLGIAIWQAFRRSRPVAYPLAGLAACAFLVQFAILGFKMQDTKRLRDYNAVVSTVQANASKQTMIMGAAEFMFGLGRQYRLLDDPRYGFYSGLQPELIIRGPYRADPVFLEEKEPKVIPYMKEMLEEKSERILENNLYSVYRVRKQERAASGE